MSKHRAPGLPPIPPAARRYLYGIVTALVPLLIDYGVLEATQAALWLALAAAVLGTGTALAHTPKHRDDEDNGSDRPNN